MTRYFFKKLLLTFLLTQTFCVAASYSLKDLEVLYNQQSYKEYLSHSLDIRPSLRDKKWEKMTKEMASNYIDSLIKSEMSTKKSYLYVESLNDIPVLRKDEFFQLKRTQYAHSYFSSCNFTGCTKLFKDFWRTSKRYPDYDFKFYELYREKDNAIKNFILPHFTKSSGSKFYCLKKYVVSDLFQKLRLEIGQSSIEQTNNIVTSYADQPCLKSMSKLLVKKLHSLKTRTSDKLTAYKILRSSNLISDSDEDIFFALYILQGPVVGEVFNMAWNRISKLSQQYKRRSILLSKLTQMDPLPGAIFSHPDLKKRRTIISFFHRNFPEYLENYVKTCISYFSGNGEFPLGNPTIQCDDLMKTAKKRPWIQDHLKIKYSGSKKL